MFVPFTEEYIIDDFQQGVVREFPGIVIKVFEGVVMGDVLVVEFV